MCVCVSLSLSLSLPRIWVFHGFSHLSKHCWSPFPVTAVEPAFVRILRSEETGLLQSLSASQNSNPNRDPLAGFSRLQVSHWETRVSKMHQCPVVKSREDPVEKPTAKVQLKAYKRRCTYGFPWHGSCASSRFPVCAL